MYNRAFLPLKYHFFSTHYFIIFIMSTIIIFNFLADQFQDVTQIDMCIITRVRYSRKKNKKNLLSKSVNRKKDTY